MKPKKQYKTTPKKLTNKLVTHVCQNCAAKAGSRLPSVPPVLFSEILWSLHQSKVRKALFLEDVFLVLKHEDFWWFSPEWTNGLPTNVKNWELLSNELNSVTFPVRLCPKAGDVLWRLFLEIHLVLCCCIPKERVTSVQPYSSRLNPSGGSQTYISWKQ